MLDLEMPIMNGFQACHQIIKTYKEKKANRIKQSYDSIIDDLFLQPMMVAYSSHVDDNVRANALKYGFKIVIKAPFTKETMQELILKQLLKKK